MDVAGHGLQRRVVVVPEDVEGHENNDGQDRADEGAGLNELPISEATKVSAARSPRGMRGMVVQSIGITMLLLALRTDVVPGTRSGLNSGVASSGTPPSRRMQCLPIVAPRKQRAPAAGRGGVSRVGEGNRAPASLGRRTAPKLWAQGIGRARRIGGRAGMVMRRRGAPWAVPRVRAALVASGRWDA